MIIEQMNDEKGRISDFLNNTFLPPIIKHHKETIEYIESYTALYSSWKSKLSSIENKSDLYNFTAELHRNLESNLKKQKEILIKELLFEQYQILNKYVSEIPNNYDQESRLVQNAFHFNIKENDSLKLKAQKRIKSISYSIGKAVSQISKKQNKEYVWNRTIPLKNLASHYLVHNYLNTTLKETEKYIEVIGKSFVSILNEQKHVDFSFINSRIPFIKDDSVSNFEDSYHGFILTLEKITKELNESFHTYLDSMNISLELELDQLNNDYEIIGTIELPKRKFSNSKKEKELEQQKTKTEKSNKNYKNYVAALFDRKEYYEDLLWYSSLLIGNSFNTQKYIEPFLKNTISPITKKLNEEISNSKKSISNSDSDLSNTLEFEKDRLRGILDQSLVPSLINKVVGNHLPNVLKEYLKKIERNLNEFEKEYTFVNPKNLVYRLKKDQLKEFSPKEIIYPIVIKKLHNDSDKIIKELEIKISKLNSTIIGLGQIVEYNLDSAKIKLNEDGSTNSESIAIAEEGLNRALGKCEDYEEKLVEIFSSVEQNFEKAIVDVLDDLISISNIDRLITIKLQVSKEKAIEEGKEKLQKYYKKVSNWFVWIKKEGLELFTISKNKLIGITSKVGLSSSQIELSEAMADYLSRVTDAMEKLPYVYQRLFSNEQLFDERIFVGRKVECDRLEKAIKYWLNNQISSVMLVGEKGSGTSTLINVVMQKFNLKSKVYRSEFSGTIYKEIDLLVYLKTLLQLNEISTFEQLIENLNSLKERQIIIIENIEDFFIRTVDGFNAINKLMEVITSTNSKILWITTCSVYSWDYLKKVINLNDYFIFNIKLSELDQKTVEEIIRSRHNISGYTLEFLPSEEIKKQKTYMKLSEIEKQEYLQNIYFENLNKLTSNNIAVALFIWLRSIINSDEEKIQVTTNLELDFSFLKSLSDQKLFSLMAILLHDGLSYEEHSKIFNTSLKSSQLLFATLSDDGIIFKRGGNYKINFQLYKPIINLLQDKNILH